MKLPVLAVMFACLVPAISQAAPFDKPPEGYTLVAQDDCGDPDSASHVVRGTDYAFASAMVTGTREDRSIIFDNEFCLLRYKGLSPGASYKVDVTYVTEANGSREQALEANGRLVHDTLRLPGQIPGRFIFDIPAESCADGEPLELKFIRKSGANAVVSYVRVWSTDPRPLPGKASLWMPTGPIEKDWLRQDRLRGKPTFAEWQDPAKEIRESIVPCINEQLDRGAQILADVELLDAKGLDESRDELAQVARKRDELLAKGDVSPESWVEVYRQSRWAVRRLAFKNPLLDCEGLLFVRRHHPHHMHQCARRLGAFTRPGGGICILDEMRADGEAKVTCLTEDSFANGTFSRPDLSFDAGRIVFGYATERKLEGGYTDYGGISGRTAPLYATHQVGPCHEFQVWEMGLDGTSAPRKLTEGPAENSDPLYLPDGRIVFMSHSPGGLVQCGDWALAYCVFTMNADGGDVRQLTVSKDGEWDPFLLEDGTIGFTRWEYVMKFWSPIQMVWSVRPDGTNPQIIYSSDLSRDYAFPLNYAAARHIPGTSKLACIGSAHHNTGAGPLCIVDMAKGPKNAEGLERITPVRFVETPDTQPNNGWYDCPYPLSDKYFLVSYSFSPDETETTGYGIYLLDTYGGKELIYRDEELSALFPMPLRSRKLPTVLPDLADEGPTGQGEMIIQDINEGLDDSHKGQARYVQIVECHERHIHTSPYNILVGPDSGFETKTVLGTVPVESDGSAYFRIPASKSVYFSVLDGDYRALNTMRSVTNVQGGERTSCVGCHESPRRAPANHRLKATSRRASDIEPPPWGVRTMDYAAVVQPVLDENCIRCHDGSGGEGKSFDLSARQSRQFMGYELPVSYFNLREHVKHAPIYQYYMPPGSFGSRASPVMDLLAKGHHDVKLDTGDWRRLCAWIDCNAPGIGSYEVALPGKADKRMRASVIARRSPDDGDRRGMLAGQLPEGARLVAYLDCGPEVADTASSSVGIQEVAGSPYAFGAGKDITAPWFDDISFDGNCLEYEITGLRGDASYKLGISWWDHNNAGREQSVVVTPATGPGQRILAKTKLPAWAEKREKPAELVVDVPQDLSRTGMMRVAINNESVAANAVLSEIWIIETQ